MMLGPETTSREHSIGAAESLLFDKPQKPEAASCLLCCRPRSLVASSVPSVIHCIPGLEAGFVALTSSLEDSSNIRYRQSLTWVEWLVPGQGVRK